MPTEVFENDTPNGERSPVGSKNGVPAESSSAVPIIEVEGLTKRFGDLTVLDRVSFTVDRGRVVAAVGPSGSGCGGMH